MIKEKGLSKAFEKRHDMLKKIDKAQVFLEDHLHLFQCPVCSQAFESVNNHQVICRDGHQFDLSKKRDVIFIAEKHEVRVYKRHASVKTTTS